MRSATNISSPDRRVDRPAAARTIASSAVDRDESDAGQPNDQQCIANAAHPSKRCTLVPSLGGSAMRIPMLVLAGLACVSCQAEVSATAGGGATAGGQSGSGGTGSGSGGSTTTTGSGSTGSTTSGLSGGG